MESFEGSVCCIGQTFVADKGISCYVSGVQPREEPDTSGEFDAERIRRTVALRRGLNRSRAYALTAAAVCAAGAGQCAYLAWQHVRAVGWQRRAMILVLLMILAVLATGWLLRRASLLRREAATLKTGAPAAKPDFSQLSDGSQRVANLEQIHE